MRQNISELGYLPESRRLAVEFEGRRASSAKTDRKVDLWAVPRHRRFTDTVEE